VYIGIQEQYRLFLSDFNKSWIFPRYFLKVLKYQISWKFFQWEPSCFVCTDEEAARYDEAKSRIFANLRPGLKVNFWIAHRGFSRLCDTLLQEYVRPKLHRNIFLQCVLQSSGIHSKIYVGYSESKYRLRISLAHPRDCHFAHVQWLPLSIQKPQTPFREIRVTFMFVPVR